MNAVKTLMTAFVTVSLAVSASADNEEFTLWVLPVTEQVAGALKRIQEEKKLELHEVMNGHGFHVDKNNLWLKKSQSGEFRFEYQGVQINGHGLMRTLRRYQEKAKNDPAKGVFKTEDEIYGMLKKHVESDDFARSLEYERRLQRKLEFFYRNHENLFNEREDPSSKNAEQNGTTKPQPDAKKLSH